jgi:molecular chaperone GrpE
MAILLQFSEKKMIKNIFKNKSKMTTENNDKEELVDQIPTETHESAIESADDLTPVQKLEEDLANEKDKFLRLFAEFENYKRRTSKERLDLFKTANQEVLQAMLPVMDDFDRALIEIKKSEDDVLLKGVELIYEKLKSTLFSKGLEEVEVKSGDIFNADFAEAITQIPAPSPNFKGKIVDVIEKGYKLGDKIIRFPKVVIGQ